jgi:hypothetical protein
VYCDETKLCGIVGKTCYAKFKQCKHKFNQ